MRRPVLAVLVLALMVLTQLPAEACGDKLLTMARAMGLFKAYKPWKTASILVYGVNKDTALKNKQFQSSLTQAGHKVKTIDNASQLDRTLSGGKFDLVLAEIGDAAALQQRLTALPSGPRVMPVLYKPVKEELASVEKQYGGAMKAPSAFTEHLEAIDQMMKLQARKTSTD